MELLEYAQWRNFEKTIKKAKTSCENNSISISIMELLILRVLLLDGAYFFLYMMMAMHLMNLGLRTTT